MSYKEMTLRGADFCRENPETTKGALKKVRELLELLDNERWVDAELLIVKYATIARLPQTKGNKDILEMREKVGVGMSFLGAAFHLFLEGDI